jgi:hypothetical protein
MSADEARREIEELRDTGEIPQSVARHALNNPAEAERLVRIVRIEKSNLRQESAIFGDTHLDPPGVQNGLVRDMREVRNLLFTLKAWGIIMASLFGLLCTLLTLYFLYLEATKH